jgi:hypothetical protein
MVKKGDTFHAPARLFGDDYAKEAYKAGWKKAKEHFRVARKHETKAGVWWCAYESADESDVEISAKSVRRYQNSPPADDEESESSVTEPASEADDDEEEEDWLDDDWAAPQTSGKEPKKSAKKTTAKRFVSHSTRARFSHIITLININTNTHRTRPRAPITAVRHSPNSCRRKHAPKKKGQPKKKTRPPGRKPVLSSPKRTKFGNPKDDMEDVSDASKGSPASSEQDLSDAEIGEQPSDAESSESDGEPPVVVDADGVAHLEWGDYQEDEYAQEARSAKEPAVKNIKVDDPQWDAVDYLFALLPWVWWVNASKQTNLYATQEREANGAGGRGNGRSRPWTPTTPRDICGFVAILIVMALVPLPSVEYFFTDKLGLQFVVLPSLKHVMSLVRFQQIKRYFHLADNRGRKDRDHPLYDRLFHVRLVLDTISVTFKKYYRLGWMVAVDESMVPFKGRSFMKQYLKDKPCKWGFKIWALCCGRTGYFASVAVYAGKGSTTAVHGLATDSVTTVVDAGAVSKGSVVFMDRWFTSPLLVVELLKRSVYSVGTVQTNRAGLPGDFKLQKGTKKKPTPAGTSSRASSSIKVAGVAHNLYITSWMDKKPVTFLGSAFGLAVESCMRMCRERGVKVQIPVPLMAKMYQDWMDAVDKGDMLKMVYGLVKVFTSWKPWQKLFVGLLDITLVNAWVLFKQTKTAPHANHYTFLWQVAEGLLFEAVGQAGPEAKVTSRSQCKRSLRNKAPIGNCVHCTQLDRRTRVSFRCKTCGVPLCPQGDCNYAFHAGHYKVNQKSVRFD